MFLPYLALLTAMFNGDWITCWLLFWWLVYQLIKSLPHRTNAPNA